MGTSRGPTCCSSEPPITPLRKWDCRSTQKRRDHICPHGACTYTASTNQVLQKHIAAVHEKRRDYACPHNGCTFAATQRWEPPDPALLVVHENRRDHICPHNARTYAAPKKLTLQAHIAANTSTDVDIA